SSVVTMTTSGKSKSIRANIDLQVGSSSTGRPWSMFFLASKWTDRKAPRKYSRAGITAMIMTSLYVMSGIFWAMIKAAEPIIGGISWPPVEAVASVAAATCGLKPAFFMIGIVNEPEATDFATAEQEHIHCSPEATTAALAGPPV